MIRNVVIHLQGKLPVLADLRAAPTAVDQAVLCTNVRTRDGKRPSFIDDTDAWFLIPIHEVTILELPAGSLQEAADAPVHAPAGGNGRKKPATDDMGVVMLGPGPEPDYGAPLEPDEDLLARIRNI